MVLISDSPYLQATSPLTDNDHGHWAFRFLLVDFLVELSRFGGSWCFRSFKDMNSLSVL